MVSTAGGLGLMPKGGHLLPVFAFSDLPLAACKFHLAAVCVMMFLFLVIFFFIFFFLPSQEFERTTAVTLRLLRYIVFRCYYHW